MNNCGAGVENITIAPNGKFYLCPAFYYDECSGVYNMMNNKNHRSDTAVGNLNTGLNVLNANLLKLENAPLCRNCDAYHCHRCVWSNMHSTMDINTPSHQQCVMTHIERNASRELLQKFQSIGLFQDREIKQINYLDPFDVREEF
jgi:CXXX repeat peptide maturase